MEPRPAEDAEADDDDADGGVGRRRAAGLKLGSVMLHALSHSLLIFTGKTWQVGGGERDQGADTRGPGPTPGGC